MFGLRPLQIDWLPFPPRHFVSEERDFISHGWLPNSYTERGGVQKKAMSCCKHRKAARRGREERSGRTGTLAERLKMRRRMS